MSARLILDLDRLGVRLYLSAEELRARALPGVITPAIRETIDRDRTEIIAALEVIEGTVANVQAEPEHVRTAWQREIVATLRWAEMGNAPDANLALDLAALRRIVAFGTCLDCGGATAKDGRNWCAACDQSAQRHSGSARNTG